MKHALALTAMAVIPSGALAIGFAVVNGHPYEHAAANWALTIAIFALYRTIRNDPS